MLAARLVRGVRHDALIYLPAGSDSNPDNRLSGLESEPTGSGYFFSAAGAAAAASPSGFSSSLAFFAFFTTSLTTLTLGSP